VMPRRQKGASFSKSKIGRLHRKDRERVADAAGIPGFRRSGRRPLMRVT
jgi:hypothetical protein